MYHFATNFDNDKFLLRGLALYYSLQKQKIDFCLWNLCMDDECSNFLEKLKLKNLHLIKLSDIEDSSLLGIKKDRTLREYCLTIKPFLLRYILVNKPDIDMIAWLDSDLCFFDSPISLYEELGNNSVLLTPNRFPEHIREHQEKLCGKYNAGMVIFKNNTNSLKCLTWWRERCLEWCKNYHENGKLGEQLYMDEFPKKFGGVIVSKNFGANVAYWNIEQYSIVKKANKIFIRNMFSKELPLIFYHFSGIDIYFIFNKIKIVTMRRYLDPFAKKYIYNKYIPALKWSFDFVKKTFKNKIFSDINYQKIRYTKLLIKKTVISYTHYTKHRLITNYCRLKNKILSIFKEESYALNNIDIKLKPYLSDIKNGFFVEAGSNDGISQSNTLYFEKKFGWRGLLIEAMPELATKCIENRPKAITENCALVSFDYSKKTIPIRYGGLMSVVEGGMKTKHEEETHIQKAKELKNIETYITEVPIMTLTSILDKHKISNIDFLSLDIEGYELQALKGLNINKYRPTYILVEARYKDDIDKFMHTNNYKEISRLSEHDYLYKSK